MQQDQHSFVAFRNLLRSEFDHFFSSL